MAMQRPNARVVGHESQDQELVLLGEDGVVSHGKLGHLPAYLLTHYVEYLLPNVLCLGLWRHVEKLDKVVERLYAVVIFVPLVEQMGVYQSVIETVWSC